MHLHHAVVRLTVLRVPIVWTGRVSRDHRGLPVWTSRHQRRDCSRDRAPLVRVIREPFSHQVSAEVGVAKSNLTERSGILADQLRRITGRGNDDLLREEDYVYNMLERLDVERTVIAAELD